MERGTKRSRHVAALTLRSGSQPGIVHEEGVGEEGVDELEECERAPKRARGNGEIDHVDHVERDERDDKREDYATHANGDGGHAVDVFASGDRYRRKRMRYIAQGFVVASFGLVMGCLFTLPRLVKRFDG